MTNSLRWVRTHWPQGEFIAHHGEFVTKDSLIVALNKVFILFGSEFKIRGELEILGGEFEISRRVRAFIHLQIDKSYCENLQKIE